RGGVDVPTACGLARPLVDTRRPPSIRIQRSCDIFRRFLRVVARHDGVPAERALRAYPARRIALVSRVGDVDDERLAVAIPAVVVEIIRWNGHSVFARDRDRARGFVARLLRLPPVRGQLSPIGGHSELELVQDEGLAEQSIQMSPILEERDAHDLLRTSVLPAV